MNAAEIPKPPVFESAEDSSGKPSAALVYSQFIRQTFLTQTNMPYNPDTLLVRSEPHVLVGAHSCIQPTLRPELRLTVRAGADWLTMPARAPMSPSLMHWCAHAAHALRACMAPRPCTCAGAHLTPHNSQDGTTCPLTDEAYWPCQLRDYASQASGEHVLLPVMNGQRSRASRDDVLDLFHPFHPIQSSKPAFSIRHLTCLSDVEDASLDERAASMTQGFLQHIHAARQAEPGLDANTIYISACRAFAARHPPALRFDNESLGWRSPFQQYLMDTMRSADAGKAQGKCSSWVPSNEQFANVMPVLPAVVSAKNSFAGELLWPPVGVCQFTTREDSESWWVPVTEGIDELTYKQKMWDTAAAVGSSVFAQEDADSVGAMPQFTSYAPGATNIASLVPKASMALAASRSSELGRLYARAYLVDLPRMPGVTYLLKFLVAVTPLQPGVPVALIKPADAARAGAASGRPSMSKWQRAAAAERAPEFAARHYSQDEIQVYRNTMGRVLMLFSKLTSDTVQRACHRATRAAMAEMQRAANTAAQQRAAQSKHQRALEAEQAAQLQQQQLQELEALLQLQIQLSQWPMSLAAQRAATLQEQQRLLRTSDQLDSISAINRAGRVVLLSEADTLERAIAAGEEKMAVHQTGDLFSDNDSDSVAADDAGSVHSGRSSNLSGSVGGSVTGNAASLARTSSVVRRDGVVMMKDWREAGPPRLLHIMRHDSLEGSTPSELNILRSYHAAFTADHAPVVAGPEQMLLKLMQAHRSLLWVAVALTVLQVPASTLQGCAGCMASGSPDVKWDRRHMRVSFPCWTEPTGRQRALSGLVASTARQFQQRLGSRRARQFSSAGLATIARKRQQVLEHSVLGHGKTATPWSGLEVKPQYAVLCLTSQHTPLLWLTTERVPLAEHEFGSTLMAQVQQMKAGHSVTASYGGAMTSLAPALEFAQIRAEHLATERSQGPAAEQFREMSECLQDLQDCVSENRLCIVHPLDALLVATTCWPDVAWPGAADDSCLETDPTDPSAHRAPLDLQPVFDTAHSCMELFKDTELPESDRKPSQNVLALQGFPACTASQMPLLAAGAEAGTTFDWSMSLNMLDYYRSHMPIWLLLNCLHDWLARAALAVHSALGYDAADRAAETGAVNTSLPLKLASRVAAQRKSESDPRSFERPNYYVEGLRIVTALRELVEPVCSCSRRAQLQLRAAIGRARSRHIDAITIAHATHLLHALELWLRDERAASMALLQVAQCSEAARKADT